MLRSSSQPVDVRYFDAHLFGQSFVTLLVIMDPLGSVPLFLGLTQGRSDKVRHRLAAQAVLTAAVVIGVFALFGQQILEYLGIGIPALQGAGGLLLLLVALELLTGKASAPEEVGNVSIALVPLGTPLLAGPGAIVATIVFVRQAHHVGQALAIVAGLLAVHIVLFLTLRFSVLIRRVVKDGGIEVVTRVFGLLLSAVAVELVAEGIRGFIKAG